MGYRPYDPHAPLLFGYDPVRDLPANHLARFVDQLVDEVVQVPDRPCGPGQPPFNPRLCLKVLVYGYCTGVRSSRRLEQNCSESLAYRYLVGDDVPSYRLLCTVRRQQAKALESLWVGLFATAKELGLSRVGKIVIDTTKIRADASPESVVKKGEYDAVLKELEQILSEAEAVDAREDTEGHPGETRLEKPAKREQMRDILARVRRGLAKQRREEAAAREAGKEASAVEPGGGGEGPADRRDETPAKKGELAPLLPLEGAAGTGEGDEGTAAAGEEGSHKVDDGSGLTRRMRERVKAAVEALKEAAEEGRKHVSLTDPDAQMMPEGREKKVRECHSFEGAVDKGSGLLVAAGTSQEASDNGRTEGLVEAARQHEEEGIEEVDGDSGMYSGGVIERLEAAGINTCIPDSNTAGDVHRGQPVGTTWAKSHPAHGFAYEEATDSFRCPGGRLLRLYSTSEEGGVQVKCYQAERECGDCPLAGECLRQKKARRRTVQVRQGKSRSQEVLERFDDPAHRERYHQRGRWIETVWAVLRGTLGYDRWQVRGKDGVAAEGVLFKLAYQVRKVHRRWAEAQASA